MKRRSFAKAITMGAFAAGSFSSLLAANSIRNNRVNREYDVIVCGAGPSGIAAAINSARLGAKTLLIERYGRIGGMAVQSLVGPLMGQVNSNFVDEMLNRIGGRRPNTEMMDLAYYKWLKEVGVDFLLHTWISSAIMRGNTIQGLRTLSKDGEKEIYSSIIIDATGDGDVAKSAGAEFKIGRDNDGLLQPMSIMFSVAGVEKNALLSGSEEMALQIKVGEKSWHDIVQNANKNKELPENITVVRLYESFDPNQRIINAVQINYVDGTKASDLTIAEITGRQQALQVAEFVKKNAPGYHHSYISKMPAVVGVRETRRITGEYILSKTDLFDNVSKTDAVVRSAKFVIDIHNPDGGGQAMGFAEKVKPYDIPYGCLVPKKIDNLIIAGRCISGTHEAHASYRVQCICMAIGAAAGTAAAFATDKNQNPRNIDVERVQNHLFR